MSTIFYVLASIALLFHIIEKATEWAVDLPKLIRAYKYKKWFNKK